jgi:hypothetical protein
MLLSDPINKPPVIVARDCIVRLFEDNIISAPRLVIREDRGEDIAELEIPVESEE